MKTLNLWDPENGTTILDKALLEEILGGGAEGGSPLLTTLNDADDTVITAAALIGGAIARTGATAAATDTTVTAQALIDAIGDGDNADLPVGSAWYVNYVNQTAQQITLAGGTGVTASGALVIPPYSSAMLLLTYSADTPAFTLVGLGVFPNVAPLPAYKLTTAALESATMAAANLAGADSVTYVNTGTTPANLQMPTAAALWAILPNPVVGYTYELNIRNGSGSANTATITTNTGITLSGTMTIAQNATCRFLVTFTSATAATVTSVGLETGA